MVDLIKLCMNSLYGQSIRQNKDGEYIIRSENWLITNNDDRVDEYEPPLSGEYVFKNRSDPFIDKTKEVDECVPLHLGNFFLSHSKRILYKSIHEMDGF